MNLKLNETKKDYIKAGAALLISSGLITMFMTMIHFTNEGAPTLFLTDGGFSKLLFTGLFILLFQTIVFSIFPSVSVSVTASCILFLLFAFAVNITYVITGDPLQPSDFLLAGELKSIVSFVKITLSFWEVLAIIAGIVVIAGSFFIFRLKRIRLWLPVRIGIGIISISILSTAIYLCGFNTDFINDYLPKIGVYVLHSDPAADYLRDGALLSFIPKIGTLSSPDMEGYSQESMEDIRSGFSEPAKFYHANDKKPSIITIQNEAWWDPTLLTNVNFSKDPMEFCRNGGKNIITGKMVTPVFAGGTCIPEFEYLTGYSSVFLPPNCYPYIQAVTGKTPSIVWTLKNSGYQTAAIHTYKTNFYGRKKAYPLMGFDSLKGVDEMDNPELRGFYVADREMAKQIISTYENKTSDKIFIYGVTMQNHGDYSEERYAWHDVEISSDTLSPSDLQGLNDFTQGVYDADNMFRSLTEYFSSVEEPVIIIMYGDHLPLLGTDGSTYIDGGMIPDSGEFDYTQHEELFKTPYIIWSNYPLGDYNISEEMSAVGLSMFTLKVANLDEIPWYYMLINEFNSKYPIYTPNVIKNAKKETVPNISDEDWPTTYAYKLLQYDLLYGNKFSE